jgi:hypothetical protein
MDTCLLCKVAYFGLSVVLMQRTTCSVANYIKVLLNHNTKKIRKYYLKKTGGFCWPILVWLFQVREGIIRYPPKAQTW